MTEQFDINRCTVGGVIQKIWDRDGDIFLRLAFQPEEDKPLRYLTARLPEGTVGGQMVSLQPGDKIRVFGYLADAPYTETIREFLWDARKKKLQDELGEKFAGVRIKRVGTRLDVLELERLEKDADPTQASVSLQGVVAKTWESGTHLMARLAVYDRHTRIIGENGSNGRRPKRKPHYITVQFVDGKAGEQEISLKKKGRVRLTGDLQVRFYKETLREVLIRSKAADRIGELDGIDPDEIYAIRDSLHVVAESAIVMGRAKLTQPA